MSRLSVIIPAHNRAHLIEETLRSLLGQTLPADEIIVVDDGSTDNTVEVVARHGPRVRVIRRFNGGPAAARNTGFAASTGEFIHFFDSDDLAAPNKHAVQVEALTSTGADIAYGPWVKGHFGKNCFLADNLVLQQRGLPRADMVKALLTCWSVVPHAAIFRRSIVEKAGGFPEDLFVAEDQYLFLKALLAGARVVHTPETIEFYRLNDAGKITEAPQGHARRLHEWGRFLLKARIACLEKNIEPLLWFGYRRRIWEVIQELHKAGGEDVQLLDQLQALVNGGISDKVYRCACKLDQWWGGLQQRLAGGRADASFQIGPMTGLQKQLLQRLGYEAA